VAGLRLPFAPNAAECPRRIDDGAIAGLIDSCAAFASYLDDGASFGRSGVTVSMSFSLHAASESDAFGHGVVLSRQGSSRIAHVEVTESASGHLLASGMAVYRIVPG
jgi:acyl-coenzyme A thioesterase PaaI-like protein